MIRRQIAVELGIIVPPVRIRDNMRLGPNDYAIKIRGQTIAHRRETYPDQFMAMDNGRHHRPAIPARRYDRRTRLRPARVLDHRKPVQPGRADELHVVEATAVLATHLTEVVKSHGYDAADASGSEEPDREPEEPKSPALVEEVIPTQIKPGELQRVMQNLLRERVPVRDLETIVETLGDWSSAHQGPRRAD